MAERVPAFLEISDAGIVGCSQLTAECPQVPHSWLQPFCSTGALIESGYQGLLASI